MTATKYLGAPRCSAKAVVAGTGHCGRFRDRSQANHPERMGFLRRGLSRRIAIASSSLISSSSSPPSSTALMTAASCSFVIMGHPLFFFLGRVVRSIAPAWRWCRPRRFGACALSRVKEEPRLQGGHNKPYAESKKTLQCKDFLQYLTSIGHTRP